MTLPTDVPAPAPDRRGSVDDPLLALVVGAGFGGIGMAARLRDRGLTDFVVLEKAHGLGGVWRDNTYPGAACDVRSNLYSFSFRLHDWTRTYADQDEILDYLQQVAHEYHVVDHCRFGREVARATWDESSGTWEVVATDGERWVTRALVTGVGQLSRPAWPDLPGLDDFAGPAVHSARWDHDIDYDGARVAVVGTGASAVQFVPGIVDRVDHLTVFQRSAPWVFRRNDRPYRRWERAVMNGVPGARRLNREWIFWVHEMRVPALQRRHTLLRRFSEAWCRRYMDEAITDLDLRAKVEPDYAFGCKRVLISDDWFQTLDRANVDLDTTGIGRIVPEGVITTDGRLVEADVLLLGTGFRSTDLLAPMAITGRQGAHLGEAWADGAEAYLGITVPKFPNLFVLYGPNTNLGHNSIVYMLEQQIDYVLEAVEHLHERVGIDLDVRSDVHDAFNAWVQEAIEETVWQAGCASWYRTASGKVTNNWPGAAFRYGQVTQFDPADFHRTRRESSIRPAVPRPQPVLA